MTPHISPSRRPAYARAALAALLSAAAAALATSCGRGGVRTLIVYEGQRGDITNVYTIDPKTGDTRQLTHGSDFDGNPAWSPDHKQIIFSSHRDGQEKNDLYLMDPDGEHVRRLTDTPDAAEWSAKFSPDGTQIAYVRDAAGGWSVWLMQADGSAQRRLAGTYPFAEFPSWTRDGKELYYSAIMPASAGTTTARTDPYSGGAAAGGGQPRAHIYSVDVATGDVRTRIATAGPDVCPHFSRDGKRLTYAAPRNGDAKNLDLFAHDVSSADTTGAHDIALTDDPARDDYGNPSPDDGQLVFISDRDGNAELYLMDRDGKHQRRLSDTPDVRENVPDW